MAFTMSTKYHIGTSGFHYDDWRGRFYPQDLPRSRWLEFYATKLDTVELNITFYRLPKESAFEHWRDVAPEGFVYAVKASRYITHIKRLRDIEESLDRFIKRAQILGNKLGTILYQLPPNMHRDDDLLESFLEKLPDSFKHTLEFRHNSWFNEAVFGLLRKHGIAFCVSDMPELEHPLTATAGFAYIRFHGPGQLYASRYTDGQMKDWAEKISELVGGLEDVYIYFNNDVSGYAIENAGTLREYLEVED